MPDSGVFADASVAIEANARQDSESIAYLTDRLDLHRDQSHSNPYVHAKTSAERILIPRELQVFSSSRSPISRPPVRIL